MFCIKCNSKSPVKRKNKSGREIYRCPKCRKTFSELTNTNINGAQLNTEQIIQIKQLLEAHVKVTYIARIVKVSRQTVYHYRHRFNPEPLIEEPENEA